MFERADGFATGAVVVQGGLALLSAAGEVGGFCWENRGERALREVFWLSFGQGTVMRSHRTSFDRVIVVRLRLEVLINVGH